MIHAATNEKKHHDQRQHLMRLASSALMTGCESVATDSTEEAADERETGGEGCSSPESAMGSIAHEPGRRDIAVKEATDEAAAADAVAVAARRRLAAEGEASTSSLSKSA